MDTNVDALKNLFKAFGGSEETVANMTTSAEVINALASHVSGGGAAELPAVTSSNNGQVLTVVSGKWAAAALPGG